MPQIIFKGIEKQKLIALSDGLIGALSKAADTPEDWFILEHNEVSFIYKGVEVPHYPVVAVWWFARPQEVQDHCAMIIQSYLRQVGYGESQISFHTFDKEGYYE